MSFGFSMSGLALFAEFFHFLRPWLLLLLPAVAGLWWLVRWRGAGRELPEAAIAPHLRAALTLGRSDRRRLRPVDGVALGLVLAVLGAAGPTWSRVPDPFVAQAAPMVIALRVAPSMAGEDVAPSRLERAKQKIRDLIELRAGARTALVAYAGSAHSVVPMTGDAQVVQPYLEGLAPDVMPREGNDALAALALAQGMLARESAPGGVLLVTDSVSGADVAGLDAAAGSLAVLAVLPPGTGDAGLDALTLPVVALTPDGADVAALDRRLNAAFRRALAEDGDQPWDDRGWLLAWPAALLTLIWFRRGWTMRWAAGLALGLLSLPGGARAEGMADWFLTPDQQGRIAYERKHYPEAAEHFTDPMWQGMALMRAGRYEEAAQVFARLETAEAAFALGLASIRNHAYRDGVRAYETALARDPDFPDAAANLALARRIVDYVETAQEQSDIGEQQDMGADDVTLDNEENRGQETEVQGEAGDEPMLTAEQWINTVDTDAGDFLRQRFAVEAAQAQ
ncbi:VWA domain-containing protein [Oceanicella sp. SM1341]|uniref:VWA domain-containing protein n=1 Tax=Oceanicella sp. SM1341 TaxID=1548889 RepID=UPI001E37C8B7|nr:VWA domain-containing protein [Oceanicella sp. SM1341]